MAAPTHSDRPRRSGKTRSASEGRPAEDQRRILTPADSARLSVHRPSTAQPSAPRLAKVSISHGFPPSLGLPARWPATAVTSGTTHVFPTTASPAPASPVARTTSASDLLSHINTPDRSNIPNRRSSLTTASTAPDTSTLGPLALSSHPNRSSPGTKPSISHQDDGIYDHASITTSSNSLNKGGSSAAYRDRVVSSPSLLRQTPKVITIADPSLSASNDGVRSSSPESHDPHIWRRLSSPSGHDGRSEAVKGDSSEPEVTGLVTAEVEPGDAIRSLKRLGHRRYSPLAQKKKDSLKDEVLEPEEARQVLTHASSQSANTLDSEHTLGAHSQMALLNEEDKKSREYRLDDNQELSERNEHGVLANYMHQSTQQYSAITSPPDVMEQFIESSEPRLRRRDNFPMPQRSTAADAEQTIVAGESAATSPMKVGEIQTVGAGPADVFTHRARQQEEKQWGTKSGEELNLGPQPKKNEATSFASYSTVPGRRRETSPSPRKLTAIERQIKDDSARVHSVTGKVRPSCEVSAHRQKGAMLSIDITLDLHLTLPSRGILASNLFSARQQRSVHPLGSLFYSVRCAALEIHKGGLLGRLILFSVTTVIWCLSVSGLW